MSEEAESPDVVHKKFGVLTAEDKQRLTKEGIPNYTSDADIMNAKYIKDTNIMKSVELIDRSMCKKEILEKVLHLCKNLTEDGGMEVLCVVVFNLYIPIIKCGRTFS